LYADDAIYQTALILEQEKKDLPAAMELYSTLLKNYPGSIFVADSRKRFRLLRGDKLN
jgi:outer membrane protein assembly factor BamD (BamD/ComL family)